MQIRNRNVIAIVLLCSGALLGCAHQGAETGPNKTAGEYVDDATLTGRVKAALINDPVVAAHDINVDTYRGVVQLTGYVDTQEQVTRAMEIARRFEVKDVQNNLRLKGKEMDKNQR